jgi:hypothetical protein
VDPPSQSALLAWYRPAVLGHMARTAVTSTLLTTGGTTLVGFTVWSGRVLPEARPWLLLLGGLCVVAGPLSLLVSWHRLLMRDDGFLALRVKGVDIQLAGHSRFIMWDELIGVRAVGEHGLELELRAGERLRVEQAWSGETAAGVARAIETTRKRAGLGLIRAGAHGSHQA